MIIKIIKNLQHPKLGLLKQGSQIEIEDEKGFPTDIFWRNRLKDSVVDEAIAVVDNVKINEPLVLVDNVKKLKVKK